MLQMFRNMLPMTLMSRLTITHLIPLPLITKVRKLAINMKILLLEKRLLLSLLMVHFTSFLTHLTTIHLISRIYMIRFLVLVNISSICPMICIVQLIQLVCFQKMIQTQSIHMYIGRHLRLVTKLLSKLNIYPSTFAMQLIKLSRRLNVFLPFQTKVELLKNQRKMLKSQQKMLP